MSFTATHFSPYTVYVDTNNLTATGTTDITPKTGDPIEPKWFLSLGLALLSILTFLMRGSKRRVVKVVS
jgi:LPXTG-motif cell wall-anchored protein